MDHLSCAHNRCTSTSSHPYKYNKSTMVSEFNLFGAILCTFFLALKATPSPAAESISRSLAPSPTERVDRIRVVGISEWSEVWSEVDVGVVARESRSVRFIAAVIIG